MKIALLLSLCLISCRKSDDTTPDSTGSVHSTDMTSAMGTVAKKGPAPKAITYRESSSYLLGDKSIMDEIFKAWPKKSIKPKYSEPLSRLARSLKSFGGKPASPGSLLKVAASFGIATPWISQTYVVALNYPDSYYTKWLRSTLLLYVGRNKVSHFGFAVVDGKSKGEKVGIMLLQKRKVHLDPFSQAISPGKPLKLSGKVTSDVKKIELLMTWPGGKVTRRKMSLLGAGVFAHVYKFCTGKGKGHYSIELMGEDAHGPVVLALFPMACGSSTQLKKAVIALKKPTVNMSVAKAAKDVFTLVNKYRAKRKLKPLKWHKKLSDVSLSHSNEMCQAKNIYHVSPITGAPDVRMKRAGLKTDLVAENVAVASSPSAIVDSWIMSEGHRLNMILKDGVYGGVGICKGTINKSIHYYGTLMVTGKIR